MKESKFRRGVVKYNNIKAGTIEETDTGFVFTYDDDFIKKNIPISHSIPTTKKIHKQKNLFSFFDGLLPEGWYLDIVSKKLKIDQNDKFGLLLATCRDTIGAVTVEAENEVL